MPRYSMHLAGPGLEIFEAPPSERARDWEERIERRAYWRRVRALVRAVRVEAGRIAARRAVGPTAPATPVARIAVAKAYPRRDGYQPAAADLATTKARETAAAEIIRAYIQPSTPARPSDPPQPPSSGSGRSRKANP